MITVKLDYDKIDQARLFKGQKGRYLDLVLIETPNGQYGDYMVKQSVTKEERLAGLKLQILGNAKNIGGARSSAPAAQHSKAQESGAPPY